MTPSAPVDPCRCPLCGQANACSMASAKPGEDQAPCWCTLQQFSPRLLQQVPAPARNKACICAACVQADRDGA